jgi:hypothetical protein
MCGDCRVAFVLEEKLDPHAAQAKDYSRRNGAIGS